MSAVRETRQPEVLIICLKADLSSLKDSKQSSLTVVLEGSSNRGFKDFTNFWNPAYSTIENGKSCRATMFASSRLDLSWLNSHLSKSEAWGDDADAHIFATNSCILVLVLHILKCLWMWLVPDLREAANISLQCLHCPCTSLPCLYMGITSFQDYGFQFAWFSSRT